MLGSLGKTVLPRALSRASQEINHGPSSSTPLVWSEPIKFSKDQQIWVANSTFLIWNMSIKSSKDQQASEMVPS